ncbi:MAG: hypothetical protein ACM3UU_00635 [Ignavibacteriales bacterium]
MRILIIDDLRHEELEVELKKHGVFLEYEKYIPEETDEEAYNLIILCPKSIEELRRMFDTLILRRMNPVVLYENADDRFINFCYKLGCIDIVRKPYNPDMLSKRLVSVIESLSARKAGAANKKSYEIQINVEDFVKREIKKASRSQSPLGLIALGFADGDFSSERAQDTLEKLRKCLRDTDFVYIYDNVILVMLHECGENDIKIIEKKLFVSAGDTNIYFYSYIKNKFFDKNPDNELEEIKSHLLGGLEKELISIKLKKKARGL